MTQIVLLSLYQKLLFLSSEKKKGVFMANIKQVIKQSGLKQYEVADYLGIRESNFSRDLRYPISKEYENKILMAIRVLQMQKERGQM